MLKLLYQDLRLLGWRGNWLRGQIWLQGPAGADSIAVCVGCSVVSHSVTAWTAAHQAPLYMGSPRQEDWSGLPFPAPGHLPHPGTELTSPVAPALAGGSLPLSRRGSPALL